MSRRRPTRGFERISRFALAAMVGVASLGAYTDDLARGDSAWASRADGEHSGRPQARPILEAVSFYETALSTHPDSLEARWKLLRALHFAGDFATPQVEDRRAIFDRAREVSDAGLGRLADEVGSGARLDEVAPEVARSWLEAKNIPLTDVARLYFWSAINWGAWSRDAGLLTAVRRGVANRLYRYTRITIALEPGYEEGGAFRLLSRLHAELPRVPFVSGWVDRDRALPLIERAYALAPQNPGNRLLLALTLLDLAPERHAEALHLLDQVGQLTPRLSLRIEDLRVRSEAQQKLAAARSESA